MFSGTVDSIKWLLMEDDLQMMLLSNLLHYDHKHHILVYRLRCLTKQRSTFKLIRSNLIVTRLKENSKLVGLGLKILHK